MVDIDGGPAPGSATLVRVWDVTNITPRHGKFRQIEAASGRRSALDWIWFRRPDCEYGEVELKLGTLGTLVWEAQPGASCPSRQSGVQEVRLFTLI